MADPTADDVDKAEAQDLQGVTSVRHGDKGVTYDADARRQAIARNKARLNKRPHVGFVRCGKGY